MDDPETRDREPDGTEGPETGASLMRAGPEGSPEAIGTSLAGAAGPVRATLDGVLGAEGPTTAIGTEDATLAARVGGLGVYQQDVGPLGVGVPALSSVAKPR